MKEHRPEIVWRGIDTIREWPHNNKTHPPEQVDRIANSIKSFGFDQPVVIDADGVIIKGAGRVLASRKLGLKAVPTIVRTDLSPAEVKASRIADNKAAISEFDFDAMSIDLAALEDEGFDLALTGWSMEELSDIAAMQVPGSMEEIDDADEQDEKPAPEPDGTEGWGKLHMKLPPETLDVFWDLMHRARGKPHEQFEALLGSVDIMALEELARTEARAKR